MGRDKALVVVDGVAMGARMLDTLRLAGCDPVVFVGGEPGLLHGLGAAVVADMAPGEGPLGGVVTALDSFVHIADQVIVVSCDMPFLTAADLEPLVARAEVAGVDVVVGRSSRPQPLCAVWSTGAVGRVRAAFERGTRSILGVLDELDTEDVRVSMQAVRNINTLGDLDQ